MRYAGKIKVMDQGSRRNVKIGQVCPVFRNSLASDAGVSPAGLPTSNFTGTLKLVLDSLIFINCFTSYRFIDFHQSL